MIRQLPQLLPPALALVLPPALPPPEPCALRAWYALHAAFWVGQCARWHATLRKRGRVGRGGGWLLPCSPSARQPRCESGRGLDGRWVTTPSRPSPSQPPPHIECDIRAVLGRVACCALHEVSGCLAAAAALQLPGGLFLHEPCAFHHSVRPSIAHRRRHRLPRVPMPSQLLQPRLQRRLMPTVHWVGSAAVQRR